jgi:hypothetical protein
MENVVAEFFISGNVPSSKNSKRWMGNNRLVSSAYTQRYIANTAYQYNQITIKFKEALSKVEGPPYFIEFTFVRQTKQKFDYININQVVADLMVKHGIIADDDTENIKPYYGDPLYNKDKPGVIIRILKKQPLHYDSQDR